MAREHTDPQQLPGDADGRDLAAYVGEDVGRVVMLRVAALAAVVTLVAGFLSESATEALTTACLAAGAAGIVLLLLAQLLRWRRTRQWVVILGVTVLCTGLLTGVVAGSRA
ncbi:hypothetical protein ASG88_04040 [Nocardioides sp. Soil777]|uniref:hypothetical protein n=1 Tax=Nocardioides sp. Soil777 TaxID=1736409 RepID=UPI0007024DD8|nr:hypothetical protein [Nocardioides sp. Soil777]KRF02554.1 hypothetical protein ASG88_04040 [Nocardioides sp. Soil777]